MIGWTLVLFFVPEVSRLFYNAVLLANPPWPADQVPHPRGTRPGLLGPHQVACSLPSSSSTLLHRQVHSSQEGEFHFFPLSALSNSYLALTVTTPTTSDGSSGAAVPLGEPWRRARAEHPSLHRHSRRIAGIDRLLRLESSPLTLSPSFLHTQTNLSGISHPKSVPDRLQSVER